MRTAVLSDIHGTCVALDAVLDDLRRDPVDQVVCLGDAIQGGPQPAEVVARLRDLGCPVVMGNSDAWLLTGVETGAEKIEADRMRKLNAVREWSLARLSEDDRAFIRSFQPTVEVALEEGHSLLAFHGSPASFDEIILPDIAQEALYGYLGSYHALVMAGGHTHEQFVRRIGADARIFFNPGSVGVAYSHYQHTDTPLIDPWAEYAVLISEGERLALEFRRVPYDVSPLIEVYRSSKRPYAEEAIQQIPGGR